MFEKLCAPSGWSSLNPSNLIFGVDYTLFNGLKLSVVRHRYQKEGAVKFSLIVPLCFDFQATDPKDKVLGVLSMVKEAMTVPHTMTVGELYTSAVWSCFSDPTKGIDPFPILAKIHGRKNTNFTASLPSWTPDLSVLSGLSNPQEVSWRSDIYNAGGLKYQFPAQEFDGKSLRLRCAIIDSISALSTLEPGQDVKSVQFVKDTNWYPSGESISNVL